MRRDVVIPQRFQHPQPTFPALRHQPLRLKINYTTSLPTHPKPTVFQFTLPVQPTYLPTYTMVATQLSARVVVLLALALGVAANPLEMMARQTAPINDPCAVVRCAGGYTCEVVGGKAKCLKGKPCGPTTCGSGTVCCNASCGICTKPGMACIQIACEPAGKKCGPNVCAAGEECCNESCGICTPPGGVCTQQFCIASGPKCGKNVCPSGFVCCNSSCGVCTPPNGACTQQICPSAE